MNYLARLVIAMWLLSALSVTAAAEKPAHTKKLILVDTDEQMIYSVPADAPFAKAGNDTFLLMESQGSGAPFFGDFENGQGEADWNGWTSSDETNAGLHWHVSSLDPVAGLLSAWCGEETDFWTGYGNNYYEMLEWRGRVDDPELSCTVTISAVVHYNVEIYYDGCYIGTEAADGIHDLWTRDGGARNVPIDLSFTYEPGDYIGDDGDEVLVYFRVSSDDSYSDEDGENSTTNPEGAMHVDDVTIGLSNGTGVSHDFEDGTLGPFTTRSTSFGDFAKIWTNLQDADDCSENHTPQVAFIDDGVVVPGTGGSPCQLSQFCYGPDNYVVNTTGGLMGNDDLRVLNNAILSPVMAWPNSMHDGALLELDVYSDSNPSGAEGFIVWSWHVRATADPDPAALEQEPWLNDYMAWYGGPYYRRHKKILDFALKENTTYIQIMLKATDISLSYGFPNDNVSPGPYFDNVRIVTYASKGPSISARARNLAQDDFPEYDGIAVEPDEPLSANSVRFDIADNIYTGYDFRIVPGDSVVVTVIPRGGTELTEAPRLYYHLAANPLFDPYRSSGLPNIGSVACVDRGYYLGFVNFSADLPDTGFLFPGDVLHYYFSATDQGVGDAKTSIMPDTTGFSDFGPLTPFSREFTVQALPSLSNAEGAQPRILFWNDYQPSGSTHRLWIDTLHYLGFIHGIDFDVYCTTAASGGHDNGLGGRAVLGHIRGYDTILYTSGSLAYCTLGSPYNYGSLNVDLGDDLGLLASWLNDNGFDENRFLFLSGDHLASDLSESSVGEIFLRDRVGVSVDSDDVSQHIGDQRSPGVTESLSFPFWTDDGWYLDGECPEAHTFDAVQPSWSEMLSGFTAPGGDEIAYPYAAATRRQNDDYGRDVVIFLPYGLYSTAADPVGGDKIDWGPHVNILHDVLSFFDYGVSPVPAPRAGHLQIVNHPNPFNPATVVAYTIPGPGHLEISIYDVAGRRVATLLDSEVATGGSISWDGANDMGQRAASGVYFCKARFGDQAAIQKIMMIK